MKTPLRLFSVSQVAVSAASVKIAQRQREEWAWKMGKLFEAVRF